jgi:hypothetical protein
MPPLSKNLVLVASVFFIVVNGWLLVPGREPKCIICNSSILDLGVKVIGLALGLAVLAIVARIPTVDGKVGGAFR